MRILLGALAMASGAIAFLSGWATLFLLEAGGVVPFFGIPLALPGALALLLVLTVVSALCLAAAARDPRQRA